MLRQETSRRDLVAIIELLTALVTSGLEPDAVMKEVAERAAFLTGATGAAVEMVKGDEMIHRAVWGAAACLQGYRLKRAGSLSGLCVELSVPLNCLDTASDPRVDPELCARLGVASVVCVPLSHGAQTVGVLKVFSPQRGAFNDVHIGMLRLLATVVALSLGSLHYLESAEMEPHHDSLTAMRNRRAYDEELPAEMARARRYERPLSLALLNLHGLRAVNDREGGFAGEEVLRRTAATLRRSLRHVDRCYRMSGGEFAILFPETGRDDAELVLARILPELADLETGISASAGVAELNGWLRPSELHRAAQQALLASEAISRADLQKEYQPEAAELVELRQQA